MSLLPDMRIGIAVSTFNRAHLLYNTLEAIREFTESKYDLVVCDDGSTDGTIDLLLNQKVDAIIGKNRGVAWNKNRGLFYLFVIKKSDFVLLLDDDITPVQRGWEKEWLEGINRFGHINFASERVVEALVRGNCSAVSPGVSPVLGGQCIAYSRYALSYLGYMDTRFTGYGHEHTEMTLRAIRAGFGGRYWSYGDVTRYLFYVMYGGLQADTSAVTVSEAGLERNTSLLKLIQNESIYRHAWRDDAEMAVLKAEIESCLRQ